MNLKYFIVFVAGMAALAGCQEASEYIPSIYITEAQRQEVKTITISQAGEKAEFTVSAAQIVDRDTHVSFEACPELVADYNDRYGRTAVALEDFTFAKKEVVIAAGKNVSESVEVVVNEELKPGTFYCLRSRSPLRTEACRSWNRRVSFFLYSGHRLGVKRSILGQATSALFRLSPSIPHLKD